jgi:hypothetical protein
MGEINNLRNLLTPAASGGRDGSCCHGNWPRARRGRGRPGVAELLSRRRTGVGAMRPAYAHWRPFTAAAAEERARLRGGTSAIEPIAAATRPAGALLDFSTACCCELRAMCSQSSIRRLAVRIVTLFTM